jgi:hypothetical protein
MSGDRDAGGLGNSNDNVGRFFQDHPWAYCAEVRTARPRGLQDAYSLFYRRGRRYLPKLALAPEVQRAERVLNCAANLDFEFADEGLNALRSVYRAARQHRPVSASTRELGLMLRSAPAAVAAAYRRLVIGRASSSIPARILVQAHVEHAPNPDSRVTLSNERDALGCNLARVEWRITDLERRTAEVMASTVDAEFRRLGLADAAETSDWRRRTPSTTSGRPGWGTTPGREWSTATARCTGSPACT